MIFYGIEIELATYSTSETELRLYKTDEFAVHQYDVRLD